MSYAVIAALASVALMSFAPHAVAQNAGDQGAAANGPPASASGAANSNAAPAALEEVTVTGTRIKRADLQSISPLVTIDSAQLESKAGVNLESYLNQLPQYNPAQTPTTENEDVQPSGVNTVGISTISLRGLGPNRGLVLIDGHRTTPVNALLVTDINTIPEAMIDHVEIISGGASAVYGADAMAGVTNFITKKNFEGAQFDVQDSITQAGDGNELEASGLMGTKIGDNGHIMMGLEYYNRNPAYQDNRSYYTDAWTDPDASAGNAFFIQGYNGYDIGASTPSVAAVSTIFANRTAAGSTAFGYSPFGPAFGSFFGSLSFNNNGTLFTQVGPESSSNYLGPTSGDGFGLVNEYNGTEPNSANAPGPDVVQGLKWSNPTALVSEPQTRYSFFANGTYDLGNNVQFYTNARFAESLTATLLDTPTSAIYGWEADIPFNATTDSPINPALVTPATSAATLAAIAADFANGTAGSATIGGVPVENPGFIAANTAGAQHPVPWQLAMLLMSREPTAPGTGVAGGASGPVTCSTDIAASLITDCANGATPSPSSWILNYYPAIGTAPQRSTIDTSEGWQMETGFKFPMFSDWTADLYYSRGQSLDYENAYGNDSLDRFRSVLDSPDYGAGQEFQGNANGASPFFGTSVPSTCTSGYYNAIFYNQAPSADCQNAIGAVLQTYTGVQQDNVEADFGGSLFKLPAGEVSAAAGFEYLRDAAQFTPDGLQSTNSFLDESIGLYPLGTVNAEIASREGYGELFIPILSNLKFMQALDLDVGGRYSDYTNGIPNASTFKVSADAQITKWFRLRGGFNRAIRAPNLGELYLGEQEYFGGGAIFGDPCSTRSLAPFGAGDAAPDVGGSSIDGPEHLAGGQTAAGAASTYLICQAQMGATGVAQYYGATGNQAADAAPEGFAWLNEIGNPNLTSEQANTFTGGFVISNLGDNPWLAGLNGSVDWWQIDIDHAIELDSPDDANYLCYGTVTVTTIAEAEAQAASPACENVSRNLSTGAATTALLEYTNQATIGLAGVDFEVNWFAQLADLGLKAVPGGISFSTVDSILQYYKTKNSPADFDVDTNWKGSMGPTLSSLNAGAFSYRLFTTVGYVLPSVSVSLGWQFYPSVNSVSHAQDAAIIANNQQVAATGKGTILSYTPDDTLAIPAYSLFNLNASWTVNKWLQIRGGINNLLDKEPPNEATTGFPVGTNLNTVCSTAAAALGCVNPTGYSLPNDGAGQNGYLGYYDIYGRTFFLGFKATF